MFMQGLETHRNTGYPYGIAIALDNVGTAYYCLGNEREALYYLRQSIREARDIKADFIALDALVWVAGIRARNGERQFALELLGMIRHHPKTDPETVQNIEELLSHMAVGMNLKSLHVVEETGKGLDLSTVINEIL